MSSIAALAEVEAERKDPSVWRTVPNRQARRGMMPPKRTAAARRRALAGTDPHWARVNAVTRILGKRQQRKAIAAERRILQAAIDAEKALRAAELAVLRAELA